MIIGFADIHNHQHANEGFGGQAFWGAPFGPIGAALPHCNSVHGPGGTLDTIGNAVRLMYTGNAGPGHPVGGNPEFDGWPRWDSVTHQTVYADWLKRAVDGGMRLMVMLAVNSEPLAGLANRANGHTGQDMDAVDHQLGQAQAMESFIDAQSGGAGQGWYRIVYSPVEALEVMAAGKLAVVLGIEVDYLFECKKPGDLTADQVRANLDHYYSLGVRHVFPIHFSDNGFGGTALQNDLEYDSSSGVFSNPIAAWAQSYDITTQPATGFGYAYRGARQNVLGLTPLGKILIQEMATRGMIIDVDHMSAKSKADTLDICEAVPGGYPVVAGHAGFVEISRGNKAHEGQLLAAEIDRIRRVGGMLGVILHQGDLDEIVTWNGDATRTVVDHVSGNTSNTFLQAYQYAASKMAGGPVAFGTDLNGFAGLPRPRFGPDAPSGKDIVAPPPANPMMYPFTAAATGTSMGESVIGQKSYNINTDATAHIGMLPDLIAELETMGLQQKDLQALMSSAQGYADLWTKAWSMANPALRIPDGSLLQDDQGAIFVIAGGAAFHIPDMATFSKLGFAAGNVRRISSHEAAQLPTFPVDGTLLRDANGAVYVVFGGAGFHVPDPPTFNRIFPNGVIHQLWNGALSGLWTVPADGTLLRDDAGAIWAIEAGACFHVPDPATLNRLYPNVVYHQIWTAAVTALPVLPQDGTLLRETNGAVWAIEGGARFHVPDPQTLSAVYPATPVHQLWDHALDSISLIPRDGSTFQLGPGGEIWTIKGGQRTLVPQGQLAVTRMLWPGALNQVPAAPVLAAPAGNRPHFPGRR